MHFCVQSSKIIWTREELRDVFTILQVFEENPLKKTYSASENSTNSNIEVKGQPNSALLSTIMVLGTFLVAFYLRKFRTSYFFGKKVCGSCICVNYPVSYRWNCTRYRQKEKVGDSVAEWLAQQTWNAEVAGLSPILTTGVVLGSLEINSLSLLVNSTDWSASNQLRFLTMLCWLFLWSVLYKGEKTEL